jgi:hypothetical protein
MRECKNKTINYDYTYFFQTAANPIIQFQPMILNHSNILFIKFSQQMKKIWTSMKKKIK